MNKLIEVPRGELAKFDPAKTQGKIAKLDTLIEYAKRVKDWPLLHDAIEAKIDDQANFVEWWEASTRNPGNQPKISDPRFLPVKEVEKKTGIQDGTVARWRRYLTDMTAYRKRLAGAAYRAAWLEDREFYGDHENENDEMFTPEKYVEAARTALGEIDLDPASCDAAQKTIKAARFYTKKDNGLAKQWTGRLWLNPPYSQPLVTNFIDKLIRDLSSGAISAAILLTNAATDTGWFHNAESIAANICFTRGRVKFIDAIQGEKMPTQGQAFFYYGSEVKAFSRIFSDFGFIR